MSFEEDSEIWKDIPGWEGLYQASTLGRVKSLKRTEMCKGALRTRNEKILKPSVLSTGYTIVSLCKSGKIVKFLVHRVVLMTFYGKQEGQGNHVNFVRSDNRLENLQWCTAAENIRHSRINGRWSREASRTGGLKVWENKTDEDRKEFSRRMIEARYGKRSSCG